MKKFALLTALTACTFVASVPVWSQATPSSENKVVKGAKTVGRGIMWGPKKVGHGLKVLGSKAKKVVTRSK